MTRMQARENVIAALNEQDWSACSVSVRINGLDTHWCYRDIVEVVERAGAQARHDPDPQGGNAGRRAVRGHAARPDRGRPRARADQPAHPDRDGAGHGQRRGDRADLPRAAGGDGVRRRRLRRLDPGPHHQHRRRQPRLLGAHRRRRRRLPRSATGATSGTSRCRGWWSPAAPTGCARSTGRSATSATPRATRRPRAGRPARLRGQVGDPPLPDRAGQRRVHARRGARSTAPAASSRRWSRRRPRARARSRSTAS